MRSYGISQRSASYLTACPSLVMAATALPSRPHSLKDGEGGLLRSSSKGEDRRPARRQRTATQQGDLNTHKKQSGGSGKCGSGKGGGKHKEDERTIKAKAKMLLMMMQMVRDLNAAVFDTYIGKIESCVITAGKDAGQRYSTGVGKWKENHKPDEPHPYGAPRSHIWYSMVMSLADSDETPQPAKKVFVAHISECFTPGSSPGGVAMLSPTGCSPAHPTCGSSAAWSQEWMDDSTGELSTGCCCIGSRNSRCCC